MRFSNSQNKLIQTVLYYEIDKNYLHLLIPNGGNFRMGFFFSKGGK
jgi:hypothetical protein